MCSGAGLALETRENNSLRLDLLGGKILVSGAQA